MSKTRIWTIGAVALVLVLLIAGWELGVSPTLTSITAANSQTATIQTGNAASQAQLANLQVQFKGISKLKKALAKLRESIPEDEGASAFLNEMATMCSTSGVSLTTITLAAATVYDAPTSATAPAATGTDATSTETPAPAAAATTTPAATTPAASASGLVMIPVTISVTGAFDAVRDFVDLAQNGTRLLYASQVDYSSGTDGTVSATITGSIFALQGTSDTPTQKVSTLPDSTPTPTATPTPTPTPTSTTTSTTTKSGSNAAPVAPPAAPVVTPAPTDTPTSP
jgi:Tfp pilus assembly protein PilO